MFHHETICMHFLKWLMKIVVEIKVCVLFLVSNYNYWEPYRVKSAANKNVAYFIISIKKLCLKGSNNQMINAYLFLLLKL